jgi:hypothetical protein
MKGTDTTLPAPACPDWCRFGPHGWDSTEDDGRFSRGHDADGKDWPDVPADGGYLSVSVSAGASEIQGEPVDPVNIHIEAPGVFVSTAEAPQVAAYLSAAAQLLRRDQPEVMTPLTQQAETSLC